MTHGFSRVPLSPEVNSLKAEIRGDQCLMGRGYLQDSAIVPDSSRDRTASGSSAAANASDQ
jgi:hypothetical protein